MMDEEYEALVTAMAMIDGAMKALDDAGICEDEIDALHLMRNDINKQRLALLGNGQDRPFYVSDLKLTTL